MPTTEVTGVAQRYYPARIALRIPAAMQEAVTLAARLQFTSPSEYLRRAVLHTLRADGVRLRPDGHLDTGADSRAGRRAYQRDLMRRRRATGSAA